MYNGKIHYKWSFSIAMLVYQRVYLVMRVGQQATLPGYVAVSNRKGKWARCEKDLVGKYAPLTGITVILSLAKW